MTTIYLLRHGEVHNPDGVIYGHLPGYRLSESGRAEIVTAAQALSVRGPFDALLTSPLERAQESADIVGQRLELTPIIEPLLAETYVSGYQGQPFSALPSPYITEDGVPGIEGAASLRARMIAWVASSRKYDCVIAVSHRDPIAMLLLQWMGKPLNLLADLTLPTGSLHEVHLDGAKVRLAGPAIG
jgi:broad specificity phosphatase PhoE